MLLLLCGHRFNWRRYLLALFAILCVNILSVEASPGCDICAETGQCYRAYRNMPGTFCGTFTNFQTKNGQQSNCCCPSGSYCKNLIFDCRCGIPHINRSSNQLSDYFPYQMIPIFIISCCCIACCCLNSCFTSRRHRETDMSKIPFARAVPANNPEWSGYGSTYDKDRSNYDKDGGASGAANIAGAALGGLGVGTFLGGFMGRNSPSYQGTEVDTFFVDDRVGYDIPGDIGNSGGYDIPGDIGDGNYDIQGDF